MAFESQNHEISVTKPRDCVTKVVTRRSCHRAEIVRCCGDVQWRAVGRLRPSLGRFLLLPAPSSQPETTVPLQVQPISALGQPAAFSSSDSIRLVKKNWDAGNPHSDYSKQGTTDFGHKCQWATTSAIGQDTRRSRVAVGMTTARYVDYMSCL